MHKKPKDKTKLFDRLFMVALLVVYSCVAFFKLGNLTAPQTFFDLEHGEGFEIVTKEPVNVQKVMFYTGLTDDYFKISYKYSKQMGCCSRCTFNGVPASTPIDKTKYVDLGSATVDGAFYWEDLDIRQTTNDIIITNEEASRDVQIGEVAIVDGDGNLVPADSFRVSKVYTNGYTSGVQNISEANDEQNQVPKKGDYTNSIYFDEIYFAQTAWQFHEHKAGYETTHPPLGKLIQSIPMFITGKMTPFNWRVMGVIAGIIVIIVMYFIAYELFGRKTYARLAAIITSLSGLHFVQSRLGTVDMYICMFTVLSYYSMLKFLHQTDKKYWFLLSGLFLGCAFSVKWSGAFGGLGLAVMYVYHVVRDKTYKSFRKMFRSIMGGIISFILIPAVVYFGSYMIFPDTTGVYTPQDVIKQSEDLYSFHSSLQDAHPSASKWYTWPISKVPFYYWCNDGGQKQIWLVGNYAIDYVSVVALIITLYFAVIKKDKKSLFILIAYLSLWVPYAFISRTMFLYHYIPASCFAILATVNMFYQIPKLRKFILPYILVILATFIILFPMMTGI